MNINGKKTNQNKDLLYLKTFFFLKAIKRLICFKLSGLSNSIGLICLKTWRPLTILVLPSYSSFITVPEIKKKYKIQGKVLFLNLSFPYHFLPTKKIKNIEMKFIFAAIYAVAAVAVSGQQYTGPVFITSPLTGTVYNAGKPAVINW